MLGLIGRKVEQGGMLRRVLHVRHYASNNTGRGGGGGGPSAPGGGQYALQLMEVTKKIEHNRFLFQDLNLGLLRGAKVGILGPNGSGKSSLLKIVAGVDTEFDGEVKLFNVNVGYLAQEPELDPEKDVRGNVFDAVEDRKEILDEYLEATEQLTKLRQHNPQEIVTIGELERSIAELKPQVDEMNLLDLGRKIEIALHALRCPPGHYGVTNLSGGEKRRVALCKLLISQPDVLLLDEPTNHLDAESVAFLERYLREFKGSVMAVTHDRYFLDNITNWILELDRGNPYVFKGNYSKWLADKYRRLEVEAKQEVQRNKQLAKEMEWIKQSAKARHAKSKARIDAYEKMLTDNNKRKEYSPGTIVIPPGPRLGDVVVDVKNISKSFEGRQLFKDLSFTIPPGAVVGIIGPNGSGKTTLLNILIGEEEPDSGSVKIGQSVSMAYVSQSRAMQLDPDSTVYDEVSDGEDEMIIGDLTLNTHAYLAAGSSQNKKVGSLSGGERNRCQLAKMLKRGANLIILDEPTNDLDVDVLRNLEEGLAEFAGSAIIVSHDRWFLDRLCSHILAFEKDNVLFFDGNYQEYEQDKKKRLGDKEQKAKYIKLQKL